MDACKRNGYTRSALGQFICSGGSALVGFWIVWPFETLKNQAQAGMSGSILEKVRRLPGGFLDLYRGILLSTRAYLLTYLPTCLPTYLLTYLLAYLPAYLLTC